jgi:hypothetical protein
LKSSNRVGKLCRWTLAAGYTAEVAAVFTGGMAMPMVILLATATILTKTPFSGMFDAWKYFAVYCIPNNLSSSKNNGFEEFELKWVKNLLVCHHSYH